MDLITFSKAPARVEWYSTEQMEAIYGVLMKPLYRSQGVPGLRGAHFQKQWPRHYD